MKTILLKLAGPLQSWGTGSHFESRHTDLYPSKSGILGLVAACLGYKRDEDANIAALNHLDFAVRIDQRGRLLRDYHTAHKYKEKDGSLERTYVTNRYYLEDAVFVVALGSQDDQWIQRLAFALQHPYFPPYLGRRSLPVTADFFLSVTEKGVLESLQDLPWQATARYQRKNEPDLPVFLDAGLVDSTSTQERKDKVVSFSQKERIYQYREEAEIHIVVKKTIASSEHDAFAAIGGNDVLVQGGD